MPCESFVLNTPFFRRYRFGCRSGKWLSGLIVLPPLALFLHGFMVGVREGLGLPPKARQ